MTQKIIFRQTVFLLLVCCPATFAQQSGSLAPILSDFNSPSALRRSHAFDEIKGNRQALEQPDVQEALFDLMDRENHDDGSGAGHGEGYSTYLSDLLDAVLTFTDWSNARQVCILANSDYGVPSPFAKELATKGGQLAVPCLLDRVSQRNEGQHTTAIAELMQISAVTADLPISIQEHIRNIVLAALRDQKPGVRMATMMAAERFGTADLIPILQDIAESDPYVFPGSKPPAYFVRDEAAKAIRAIQGRAKVQ